MATIGNTYLDLVEMFKRQGPEGAVAADIIMTLARTNLVLEDAIALECNDGMGHMTTVSTSLPSVTWGRLYKGIAQSKGQTAQVRDTTGFVEGLSDVDTRLLRFARSEEKRRALLVTESQMFLEAISQEVASKMFYGNDVTDPDQFMGFAPRFNSTTAENGGQIVDGGGSGSDNTSVWFVSWSDTGSHLIYPEGTRAGVETEDKGEQRVLDADSNPYYVRETLFRQNVGLSVRDPRTVVRIANIDVSAMQAGTLDMFGMFVDAFWKLKRHNLPNERQAIYCNSNVLQALDKQSSPSQAASGGTATSFVRFQPGEIQNTRPVMTFREIPIRQVDALINTESVVS